MAETSWYYYDWQMDGDPAEFAVDTRFFDKAPYENRPVLLHMRCEMKDGTELNGRGRRHIVRLEKKCKSDLKALYAGYIEDAYRRVMFFYTDKASRIEVLDDMADRERYLYCSAGASDDPEWNTYLNLLYPDAAKYYTETNRKNAQLYRKNGDCITAVRRLTLHMAFPLETLVPQFAEEARLSGFAIGDAEFNPDIDVPYGVKLHIISSLLNEDLDKYTTLAIYTAERYGGRLLYWESPVIPKNSPLR